MNYLAFGHAFEIAFERPSLLLFKSYSESLFEFVSKIAT